MRVNALLLRNLFHTTSIRKFSFITTPIFYVNGDPHIGHLYTSAMADAVYRWELMKSKGDRGIIFSAGTDEHGTKVQAAAEECKEDPMVFCDRISAKFRHVFRTFDIEPTHFTRTTQAKHRQAVNAFWNSLKESGYLYKGSYSGWYSVVDEAFFSAKEVSDITLEDGTTQKVQLVLMSTAGFLQGICTESGQRVQWTEEENYMFRLSAFREGLVDWLENNDVIQPPQIRREAINLAKTSGDLSVSRDSSRLTWGIPVPQDSTQTIYVWLDALVNYLTSAGYPEHTSQWPPDCQIVGKDILKFHAVYWPAFLMAAGMELPKKIFVHSHWTVEKSKSLGNVVDPLHEAEVLTSEGLRYFLLRHQVLHQNANYEQKKAVHVVNDEVCNILANLVSRSTVPQMNPNQLYSPFHQKVFDKFPSTDGDNLMKTLSELSEKVDTYYKQLDFYRMADLLSNTLRDTNTFFHHHAPWRDVTEGKIQEAATTLHITYEAIRIVSILLQPLLPNVTDSILNRLNIPSDERKAGFATLHTHSPLSRAGKPLGKLQETQIFERIKIDK